MALLVEWAVSPTDAAPPPPTRVTPTTTGTRPAPPRPGTNLLVNPSFDQGLAGWKTWSYKEVIRDPDNKKARDVFQSFYPPSFKVSEPKWDRLTRGKDDKGAAGSASGYRWVKFRAGFYQTVSITPVSRVRFSVWANALCEDGKTHRCPTLLRAGIDPTGNTDWEADTVRWVEVQISDQEYVQLTPPEVWVGPPGKVTVFMWGEPLAPVLYNAAYFDDASLVVTIPPTPTGAAPTAPPPSPTPVSCAQMRFVSDVTIPENAPLAPGERFVKTWRVQNSGTCAWSGTLKFVGSGYPMGGASPQALPHVQVGENKDISLELTAPSEPGSYQGTWEASTGDGIFLGRLLVKINVVGATATPSPTETPTPTPTASPTPLVDQICALVFDDADGDGRRGAEGLLAGAVLTLTNASGLQESYTTDGTSEPHCFAGLQPGYYRLAMAPPGGYEATVWETADLMLERNSKADVAFGARRGQPTATGTRPALVSEGLPALGGGVAGTGWSAPVVAMLVVVIVLVGLVGWVTTRHR